MNLINFIYINIFMKFAINNKSQFQKCLGISKINLFTFYISEGKNPSHVLFVVRFDSVQGYITIGSFSPVYKAWGFDRVYQNLVVIDYFLITIVRNMCPSEEVMSTFTGSHGALHFGPGDIQRISVLLIPGTYRIIRDKASRG